jgi:hypothetical protein
MDARVRLIDRHSQFFGYCEVHLPTAASGSVAIDNAEAVSAFLPEVIMLEHWPGRVFVRDRRVEEGLSGVATTAATYRERTFGMGLKFELRSGA